MITTEPGPAERAEERDRDLRFISQIVTALVALALAEGAMLLYLVRAMGQIMHVLHMG